MSTAVTKAGPTAVSTDLAATMLANASVGADDFGITDIALPFLKLVQSLSPEIQKGDAKYIKGLEVGDFFNSLTNEIWKGELDVIRVASEKRWLEWRPNNGGLVAVHHTLEDAKRDMQPRLPVPEGKKDNEINTEVIETAQIYMLVRDHENNWRPVVTGWTKSKLSSYRTWNGLTQEQTFAKHKLGSSQNVLPVFGVVYKLSSATKKNAKGQPYFVPVIGKDTKLVDDTNAFEMARQFRETVLAGRAKPVYAKDDDGESIPGGDSEVGL